MMNISFTQLLQWNPHISSRYISVSRNSVILIFLKVLIALHFIILRPLCPKGLKVPVKDKFERNSFKTS